LTLRLLERRCKWGRAGGGDFQGVGQFKKRWREISIDFLSPLLNGLTRYFVCGALHSKIMVARSLPAGVATCFSLFDLSDKVRPFTRQSQQKYTSDIRQLLVHIILSSKNHEHCS
jgi:hypothetical protein